LNQNYFFAFTFGHEDIPADLNNANTSVGKSDKAEADADN
jgi:hypothetical protein